MSNENNLNNGDRTTILKELIFGDSSFSSDLIFGVSGQRKPLEEVQATNQLHNRTALIKNLVNEFGLDGADINAITEKGDLKEWQLELLSESIKETITKDFDDSLSQERKFSLLLSRPESMEIMANDVYDIHLSKENQDLLEKMPLMMNTNIAIAVLNGIHQNPDDFFGKGIYGKDADEVSENLCKFIFNKGTMIGEEFSEMHNFQGWIEALERAGFDQKEFRFKNGDSNTTIDFIEPSLDLDTPRASITYETHRLTWHHDDLSKNIHEMEDDLGLKADIILTRLGEFKKNKVFGLYKETSDSYKFDKTELKRRRELFESSVNDKHVQKLVFRNKKGVPIIETIGNNGILKSRGVQLCDTTKNKPIDTNTARLMVLQFTKMNPEKKKIVINPPKNCDKDVAKQFIIELAKQAIELGYNEEAIKVTCSKGCPLTPEQVKGYMEKGIQEAKFMPTSSSLTLDEKQQTQIPSDPIDKNTGNDEELVLRTPSPKPM